MSRLWIAFASFVAVCGAAGLVLWQTSGAEAIRVGDELRGYRHVADRLTPRLDSKRPLLVWMGDSTLVTADGVVGLPVRLDRALAGRAQRLDLTYPAFDSYHHYYLMGPVLELAPDVIVLAAHLRLFDAHVGEARNDLASHIPTAELSRALALPLHERGLTIPKLLLMRLLRWPGFEQFYLFCVGAKQRFHEAALWNRSGQRFPMRPPAAVAREIVARYDVPVNEHSPMLKMLAATVEMASRRGSRVLVIASPIPWQHLEGEGLYEAGRYARRIEALRSAVEGARGQFLDLHRELREADFRDHLGHTSEQGTQILADRLQPVVEKLLFAPESSP